MRVISDVLATQTGRQRTPQRTN